jgi:hypothetical protein
MVSIIKKIIPLAIGAIGIFALANVVARPKMAQDSATALSSTLSGFGTGIGQVGTGIGSALGSIGSGSAKLLDPLFSLKTLVYGDEQSNVIRNEEQNLTASSTLIADPVVNTASDQPGVTPQAPASETALPQTFDNFFGLDGLSGADYWNARRNLGSGSAAKNVFEGNVAGKQEKDLLSKLTGGLLG